MLAKKVDHSEYKEIFNGIRQRTLVYGESTLMTEFVMKKGSEIPLHSHPHEQTGYMISGRINFLIAGENHEVMPGDSWNIAGDIEHKAKIIEDSVIIEVFSPVREDFLPENI